MLRLFFILLALSLLAVAILLSIPKSAKEKTLWSAALFVVPLIGLAMDCYFRKKVAITSTAR